MAREPRSHRPRRPFPARRGGGRPVKPGLPEALPRLPRDVYRDLKAASAPHETDDVVRAYAAAGDALVDGDLERATALLEWAKASAARSAMVREALGIAYYHGGKFKAAHAELLAYRRLSGRVDQNHLLADCARAQQRHDKVIEYIEEMRRGDVERERVVEGLIVLAGDRADRGDLRGALATLEQVELEADSVEAYHLRVWYLAGDLAEQLGDAELAADYFNAVAAVDDEFLDVAERLGSLGD